MLQTGICLQCGCHVHFPVKYKCKEMLLTEHLHLVLSGRKGILHLLRDSSDTSGLAQGLVFPKKTVQFREVRFETRRQGQVGRSVRCESEQFPHKFHTKVKLQSWCGSTSCKCCLKAGVCTGIQPDHVG